MNQYKILTLATPFFYKSSTYKQFHITKLKVADVAGVTVLCSTLNKHRDMIYVGANQKLHLQDEVGI